MITDIELDEQELAELDGIQDEIHAGSDEDLLNAKEGKGKPCGDSFIEGSDTCHVGELDKQVELERKADVAISKDLYGYIAKTVDEAPDGSVDAQHGVDAAAYRMLSYKDTLGWRERTLFFDWKPSLSGVIADAVAAEEWPHHGPMSDVIKGLKNGIPHSFITVGNYVVDPYLNSRGVSHEDINKFGHRLSEIYEQAGVEPSGPPEPPKAKQKASTSDILGGSSQLGKTQKEFFPSDYKYVPSKPWKSAGAVVFNDKGEVAIRKVKGGYGGYDFSWGKGKVETGETDEQAAHREVLEEQGHAGEIVGDLGTHKGTASDTHFYLMRHKSDHPDKMDKETEKVMWMKPEEAADHLDSARDLRVLIKAMIAMRPHLPKDKLSNAAEPPCSG